MKKLISCIISCLLYISCLAQFNVYHPFPTANAIWGEYFYDGSCGTGVQTWGYNFIIKGDTTLNGLTYHKVYKNEGFYSSSCSVPYFIIWNYSTNFYGAYREDTMKRIYTCCTSDLGSRDSLLYDFNLKVGDTLRQYNSHSTYSPQPYTVNSIDSVSVNGFYRKRFNLKINHDTMKGIIPSIIEGIGSTQGLLDSICEPFEVFSQLKCFSQNGKTIWSATPGDSCGLYYLGTSTIKQLSVSISIYPNPSNGIFTLSCQSERSEESLLVVEVFNVLGSKVLTEALHSTQGDNTINLSSQPNGVYFYRVTDESSNLIGEGKLVIQR